MWKKIRGRGQRAVEKGLAAIARGEATTIRSTVTYDGNEYTATFTPKEEPLPAVAVPSGVHALPPPCDIMRLSAELERALLGTEGRRVIDDTPWLTLPPGYSFKVTFPFCGAAARFRVCKASDPGRDISVYLDTQHVLGHYGPFDSPLPYWEAYPIEGDTARFGLHEAKELVDAIVGELEEGATRDTNHKEGE